MFKTAVILAGGEGSRLRDITKEPKPLISVNGKPHIINVINHIFLWNFSKVIILVRKDQSKLYMNHLQKLCKEVLKKLTIEIVEETEPMGTSGWVLQNLDILDNHFMVLNADTYFYENIYSTLQTIFKKNPFDYPVGEKSVYHTINAKNNLSQTGKTILLNIPTSDNFAQAVHPDVIFIKDGFETISLNKCCNRNRFI